MADQIPEGCLSLKNRLDKLNNELTNLKTALAEADPADKPRIQNLVGAKQREVLTAKNAFEACLRNPPPVTVPPPPDKIPGVPDECVACKRRLEQLIRELEMLRQAVIEADPADKPRLQNLAGAKEREVTENKSIFKTCVETFTYPFFNPAPATNIPAISKNTTLVPVKKTMSWRLLQRKLDEFLNLRSDPPIFKIRLHHHSVPGNPQPASDATISFIEAQLIDGQVQTVYGEVENLDLGLLDSGYYFNDVNTDKITVSIDPLAAEPLTIKINFECGGPEDFPTKSLVLSGMNFKEFYITLKLSLDILRFPKAIPAQCTAAQSNLDNLKFELADLEREMKNPDTNHTLLAKQISAVNKQIQLAEKEFAGCLTTFGGPDPTGFGRLEFLSWIDKVKGLEDDAADEALKRYLVAHIVTTSRFDFGGSVQKSMRKKIFAKLSDPVTRARLNDRISRWLLGGKGAYDVMSLVNDGENVKIEYLVPANVIDPFPEAEHRGAGWPYRGNPAPDSSINFSVPPNMGNIKNLVVLMMENRSFDHMLGYLSLPVSMGGAGRTDVEGLKQDRFNPFNGVNYPSFRLATGDTRFGPDPSHSYEGVYHQMNPEVDVHKNPIPGKGRMDGFVKSFAMEAGARIDGPKIMGYHTADNVPVYDALVRDFGISDYYFASHPGSTFCNRFYELTGRLNLASGLKFTLPAGSWEVNNTSPTTPVFTKNIFDYLTEYHNKIERGVTWKYYEHGYSFIRFFSNYTFDETNVVGVDDPVNGFFADAKRGTLPSVSYIDPHYIEMPPNANCDGPVADIKVGQDFVRKVVEAVITSPQYANTLLVITYDEHGGFPDHVAPPPALPYLDESSGTTGPAFPVKTYGIRVPTFFISPYVKAGSVFGHKENEKGETLYFDHTSVLKTISRRFMSRNPPYMGKRYAAANDLSVVLSQRRQPLFLPFVRHHLAYNPNATRMNVEGGTPTSPIVARFNANESEEQYFSFEQKGDMIKIRTLFGNRYLTVDVPNGNTTVPAQGFGIKQDINYEGELATADPAKFNTRYQLWKFTPLDKTEAGKKQFIISNAFFGNLVLRPANLLNNASPIILGEKVPGYPNVWSVSVRLPT